MNLNSNSVVVRSMNGTANGTSNLTGVLADARGFDSARFFFLLGNIPAASTPTVKAQSGDASDGSDAANIASATLTLADTDDNKVIVIDVTKLTDSYVRPFIDRSAGACVVDGCLIELYNPRKAPTSADSTASQVTV